MQKKISFIGSGNVATQLAKAFDRSGYTIHQIISRHKENAFKLAKLFGAYHSDDIRDLYPDIELLVIAVSDDEIENVASEINLNSSIVVHTSGAVPMNVLADTSLNYGVLYPLQSFSGTKETDLRNVPILIEGSDELVLRSLDKIAYDISNVVVKMNSSDRSKIHLAAVIVNNFTNHMFSKAEQYLNNNDLSFKILLPLIRETVEKLDKLSPYEAQTGPARRGDHETINRHLSMLKDNEDIARFYALMSKMIEDSYKE